MALNIDKELVKTAFAGFLVVILIVLFNGCDRITALQNKGKAATAAAEEIPVFAVNTVPAVEGQISDYLALAGDIVAGSTVDVYSDAAGKVKTLYTAVGRRVSQNERVAAVDPSRPGMDYVENIVRSPISGTVVALPAQVGMTISQATPIARITAGSALEIQLYVAERDISRIALSLPCEITLDAWPGRVFRGSVKEISPVVDPSSRTMGIKINVDNQGSTLKAGMFAKVRVITRRKNGAVTIPESARVSRSGEDFVYVVETDTRDPAFRVVAKRVIQIGLLMDGVLEVQDGLRPGEEVVVKGQSLLEDGARINVIR